jgi:hypothetical protein
MVKAGLEAALAKVWRKGGIRVRGEIPDLVR